MRLDRTCPQATRRPCRSGAPGWPLAEVNQKPPPPASSDQSLCEQEPIHAPGAIQPHGALVAASVDGFRVTHASLNLADFLGQAAESVLGRKLETVVGDSTCRVLHQGLSDDGAMLGPLPGLPAPD